MLYTYFEPFDADVVLEKYYERWQQNPYKKPEYYGKTQNEIKEIWKNDQEEGTRLHKAIELFYNNHAAMEGDRRIPIRYEKERVEWKQFLQFHQDHHHDFSPFRTEMKVWSGPHKLAGMIDLVVRNNDGSFTLYDWKRSKHAIVSDKEKNYRKYGSKPLGNVKDTKYYKYALQLNLYRSLLERFYHYRIRDMFVVRFYPTASSYELVPIDDRMEDEVMSILDLRRDQVQSAEKDEDILTAELKQGLQLNGAS